VTGESPNTAVASQTVFRLTGASYAYADGLPALTDVSLRIGDGERVVILGANGSGKSTLIKVLDGLLFPQQGTFEAFGQAISEATMRDEQFGYRFRRRVGFIFQNSDAQLFSPTVREEIAFGPLQMGLSVAEIEERVEDIAELLQIGKLLDRAPYQLSGGEKKKVAIASSLIINPDVLLLDEPTSGLDPRSQYWLVELLQKLHDSGKTIISATHDLNLVPDIADRALVFSEEHRLIADGPVPDVLKNRGLLLRVNLVHENLHRHGSLWHTHPHSHDHPHDHSQESGGPV
jgi:cobalt/nickel transport system ATP-binding protein